MAKLISLKKAAKISGYAPDYLGYLIRKGKLEGKRVGRDWFTTEEALRAYLLTKKFLSVRDFLSPKAHPKLTFFLVAAVVLIITIGTVLILNPPIHFQKLIGDFENRIELQKEKIIINKEKDQETQEIEVTSYISDETGEIEMSVEPQP